MQNNKQISAGTRGSFPYAGLLSEADGKFSAMGKFVGGVVHELNNPLDGVMRYVNLSLVALEQDRAAKEYLLEAKSGLHRIMVFVRSLLDLSWGLSQTGREVDANNVIDECLYGFNRQCESERIAIEKDFAPGLPKIDDYGLRVVFNNIIKNAIYAMKDKGGRLSITTRAQKRELYFSFCDTGKGIGLAVKKRIFDPFFTTKGMGEGSGLGLAIAGEIIKRYRGKIAVVSSPGKGASFNITLPLPRAGSRTGKKYGR